MNKAALLSVGLTLFACSEDTDPQAGGPDAAPPITTLPLERCIDDGLQSLWNVNNLHGPIGALALSTGGVLAVAGLDGSVKQWTIGTSAADAPLPNGRPSYGAPLVETGQAMTALGFAHDQGHVIGGDLDGNIKVWNAADSTAVDSMNLASTGITALAVSPNERDVVLASDVPTVELRIWNRETREAGPALPTTLWEVHAATFDDSGDSFLIGGVYYGMLALERWSSGDTSEAAQQWIDRDGQGTIHAVAFSADEARVYAVSSDRLMVFDASAIADGPIALLRIDSAELNGVIAVGELIVASGADGTIRAFTLDGDTLTEVMKLDVPGPAGVAMDTSGSRLVTAGSDGRVRAFGCAE